MPEKGLKIESFDKLEKQADRMCREILRFQEKLEAGQSKDDALLQQMVSAAGSVLCNLLHSVRLCRTAYMPREEKGTA